MFFFSSLWKLDAKTNHRAAWGTFIQSGVERVHVGG